MRVANDSFEQFVRALQTTTLSCNSPLTHGPARSHPLTPWASPLTHAHTMGQPAHTWASPLTPAHTMGQPAHTWASPLTHGPARSHLLTPWASPLTPWANPLSPLCDNSKPSNTAAGSKEQKVFIFVLPYHHTYHHQTYCSQANSHQNHRLITYRMVWWRYPTPHGTIPTIPP